jgi:hypothetical protein
MGEQEAFLALASKFENSSEAMYLSPDELTAKLKLGNKEMWTRFLNLEPVMSFIKSEMAHQARVAQRKAFLSLQKLALEGNVQAAKEINELSGIMSTTDDNKVIVLHQIQRPKVKQDG